MWLYIALAVQLLCGYCLSPVDSQTVSEQQVRHGLVTQRARSLFGSNMTGHCTSVMDDNICNGTSVQNDGVVPVLNGVINDSNSTWAEQLFTMERPGTSRIFMSFELEDTNHDRIELSVFNCPHFWINAPQVNVYFDSSFRPLRKVDRSFGTSNINVSLSDTSCDYLYKFCVRYDGVESSRFINLEFPFVAGANNSRVFVGEVTFVNGSGSPCGPPELITTNRTTDDVSTGNDVSPTDAPTKVPSTSNLIIPIIVVVVVVLAAVVVIATVIVVVLCLKNRKRKEDSVRIRQLQDVVMETKEEEKEAETYMEGLGNYEVIGEPHQNGFRVPENDAILDVLYSDPNETGDNFYSHLREDEKPTLQLAAMADEQYSKLNSSEVGKKGDRPPATQKAAVDDGEMYAVPDKTKKSKLPVVPEKSSELIDYLDTKEVRSNSYSQQPSGNEYSEVTGSFIQRSGSVGPVPLSNSASLNFVGNLNSNPLYQSTEILPGHATAGSPQAEYGSGELQADAIYSEPGPPNVDEPEWNPDQNIYESVYNEPLQPSLFTQERGAVEEQEELHPYSSIYTVPNVPSGEKPLAVTSANIKEIKCLGDGNFGQVVLALTVGLTKTDLRLEGEASHTLVAVKKLKDNPSDTNKQVFDKEVKFMSRLNHPNVIRLLGVCTEGKSPFIMMEYMKNGDLNQYLKEFHSVDNTPSGNSKSITTSRLVYISTQIASAMQYLASQNFIHRDLATRNCLVGSKDTIKIADFGMSRSLYESQYYVISGHAILPIRWMATECFFGKFSAKTDVWAFGVTLWEIFTLGKVQPYSDLVDSEIVEDAIKGGNRTLLERPSDCPEDVYEIMRRCWASEADQRPTFDELYNWLSSS